MFAFKKLVVMSVMRSQKRYCDVHIILVVVIIVVVEVVKVVPIY